LITFIIVTIVTCVSFSYAQEVKQSSSWQATIHRADGNNIVFNFEEETRKNRTVFFIKNAAERMLVDSVTFKNDSVFIKMPVFESALKAKIDKDTWKGIWIKGTSGAEQLLPFTAIKSAIRFPLDDGPAKANVKGRWAVKFLDDTATEATSIAELWQQGNKLTGSILTPTGDYRYLEGIVTGTKLMMSGFDGSHAVLFTADIIYGNTIGNGKFYSGANYSGEWTAIKNPKATVKQDETAMYLKPGEEKLSFKFPDLDSNLVSIKDDRFKDKVVIVQLMGSWCPNCMDETQFLSDYYSNNKNRGVEIVALAYEYSTDFERSKQSLLKFKRRFNVEYPILNTGVTVSDSLRTERTLPQVTRIKVFPSSIILDKKGRVRKLENSFYGPGTGEHYDIYKREFNETIDTLLKEE